MRARGTRSLLDSVAALEWVNQHISLFGGDPKQRDDLWRVGRRCKTSCLYAMPEAAPYFHKASIESGPGVRMLTREMATETTALVLQALNIAPNDWRKVLDVPAADLLRVQSQFPPIPPHRQQRKTGGIAEPASHGFGPVVDGVCPAGASFRPDRPGHFQR